MSSPCRPRVCAPLEVETLGMVRTSVRRSPKDVLCGRHLAHHHVKALADLNADLACQFRLVRVPLTCCHRITR